MKTVSTTATFSKPVILKTEPITKWEQIAKFKPHAIVMYGKFTSSTKATQTNTKSLKNLEKANEEGYNGYMSPATSRNVKGIIENLLTAIELNTDMAFPFVKGQEKPLDKVYPTFVTLTLPFKQLHDDNDIKREIFTPFMQEMIRNWNIKCYVWVAETQENGNLHFHVLMDRAIPALRLRQIWNKHLNKMPFEYVNCYSRIQKHIYRNGYVFREEMLEKRLVKERLRAREEKRKFSAKDKTTVRKKEEKRQLEAYDKGQANGWTDPNSTDIHAIHNIKKLTAYVTKYFTKKPEIVKPTLNPNEKWIETEGKFYVERERIVTDSELDSITYDPSAKVEVHETWNEAGEPVIILKERIEQKPMFKNRKMSGRIWGASEILKAPGTKPSPYVLAVKTWTHAWVTTQHSNSRPQTIKVEVGRDIFDGPIYQYETQQITHNYQKTEEKRWPEQNNAALKYLSIVENIVPILDVKAATLKAGVLFASSESNKVIPLREPQKDYLKEHSPPLWANYQAHYTAVFNTLYAINEAA